MLSKIAQTLFDRHDQRAEAERQRLATEQERLAVTSEMLAVAQRAKMIEEERLRIERERRQYHLEAKFAINSLHQLVTEALIDLSARIALSSHDTVEIDRPKILTKTIQIYDQRLDLLKLKQAQYGSEMPPHELLEMEDIERQIERYTAELEAIGKRSPQ